MKISAERYPEIEQKPLNSKQELEENRSTNEYKVIKIPFIENSELESRILYYSPDIEVIEPECLKEKIVNRLSDTLNKYKKNPSMQKGCIVNV